MGENNPLKGETVVDNRDKEYTVVQHVIEADELVLEAGDETQAITMMDIANGEYQVVE